jgi:hypothetical protein
MVQRAVKFKDPESTNLPSVCFSRNGDIPKSRTHKDHFSTSSTMSTVLRPEQEDFSNIDPILGLFSMQLEYAEPLEFGDVFIASQPPEIAYLDCSVDIAATPFENCSCTELYRTLSTSNWSQYHWLSDALHDTRRKQLFQGRGNWLFESDTYRKWQDTSESSILWLYGSAGTGKSMLTSAVIEHLRSNSRFGDIVVFFCGDWRFRGSIVLAILRSMLLKLSSRIVDSKSLDCLQALWPALHQAEESFSISQMKDLLSTMKHNLKSHETMFLVIDGLDDAAQFRHTPDDMLSELLRMMATQDIRHRIKCFISTRPSYFLRVKFSGPLELDIDKESSAQLDLATYVRNELSLSKMPRFNAKSNACVVDKVVEQLVSKANGNFLWVSLVIRAFHAENSTSSLSSRATRSFPLHFMKPGLCGMYDSMLDTISTEDRLSAAPILQWVSHSARPLSLRELGFVIRSNMALTEADIWRFSGGLLITGKSQTVNPVHMTAAEYLISKFKTIVGWATAADDPHEMIARVCLMALPASYLLQSLSLPSQPHQETLSGSQLPNIIQYAVRYWKVHYLLAESHSKVLPGILHNCLKIAFEGDLHFRSQLIRDEQAGEMSTLSSFSISLRSNIANIALLSASRFGFASLAKLELQMGADSHTIPGELGYNALHLAAREGHLDVAKVLLQYGADPFIASSSGHTPLAYAVYCGHYGIVELLLDCGADIQVAPLSSPAFSPFYDSIDTSVEEFELEATVSEFCVDCGEMRASYIVSLSI